MSKAKRNKEARNQATVAGFVTATDDSSGNGATITVHRSSFEVLAVDTILPFTPPLADIGRNPEGFLFHWKILYRVFKFNNPHDFPPLGKQSFESDELESMTRYLRTAQDLAEGNLLNRNSRVSAKGLQFELSDFPTREEMIGFTTLFRQLFSPGEPGSFMNTYKIIGRVCKKFPDPATDQRMNSLRTWRKAHGSLLSNPIDQLLGQELERGGLWANSMTPSFHDLNPQQLINLYAYGDLIHWGDRRQELAAFKTETDFGPMRELDFMRAMVSLTHLYLGFSILVERAMSGSLMSERRL